MHNAHTFSVDSGQYARSRPSYPPELFAWLNEISAAHSAAWDCATGSGQAALSCADYFQNVAATDLSHEQIRHAAPHARVHYSVSTAENAPFAPVCFDLITVAQALHWFDLPRFYSEAARVLKPGGLLAVFGYGLFEFSPALDAVIAEHIFAPIDPFWAPGNRLLMSGYRDVTLPFDVLEAPRHFAIRLEWTLPQLLDYLRTWSAVKRFQAETGADPLPRLENALAPLWPDPSRALPVRMPVVLKVSRKPPG